MTVYELTPGQYNNLMKNLPKEFNNDTQQVVPIFSPMKGNETKGKDPAGNSYREYDNLGRDQSAAQDGSFMQADAKVRVYEKDGKPYRYVMETDSGSLDTAIQKAGGNRITFQDLDAKGIQDLKKNLESQGMKLIINKEEGTLEYMAPGSKGSVPIGRVQFNDFTGKPESATINRPIAIWHLDQLTRAGITPETQAGVQAKAKGKL